MKKTAIILFVFTFIALAQFREGNVFKPTVKETIINDSPNLVFGFINPENFFMRHSYSMSYSTGGNYGLALGVYTNSMFYKVADNLNIQVDASLVHSPYSSYGKDHQNQINGIYLSKAQIDYKPWDNFHFLIQYRSIPNNYYFSPYYSIFNRNRMDMFEGSSFLNNE